MRLIRDNAETGFITEDNYTERIWQSHLQKSVFIVSCWTYYSFVRSALKMGDLETGEDEHNFTIKPITWQAEREFDS